METKNNVPMNCENEVSRRAT